MTEKATGTGQDDQASTGLGVDVGRSVRGLDEVDRRILEALLRDGRLSIRALAEQVHISRTNAYARMDRLIRAGVITGFHARVAPEAAGLGTSAYVALTIEQNSWREVSAQLARVPYLAHAALLGGGPRRTGAGAGAGQRRAARRGAGPDPGCPGGALDPDLAGLRRVRRRDQPVALTVPPVVRRSRDGQSGPFTAAGRSCGRGCGREAGDDGCGSSMRNPHVSPLAVAGRPVDSVGGTSPNRVVRTSRPTGHRGGEEAVTSTPRRAAPRCTSPPRPRSPRPRSTFAPARRGRRHRPLRAVVPGADARPRRGRPGTSIDGEVETLISRGVLNDSQAGLRLASRRLRDGVLAGHPAVAARGAAGTCRARPGPGRPAHGRRPAPARRPA